MAQITWGYGAITFRGTKLGRAGANWLACLIQYISATQYIDVLEIISPILVFFLVQRFNLWPVHF